MLPPRLSLPTKVCDIHEWPRLPRILNLAHLEKPLILIALRTGPATVAHAPSAIPPPKAPASTEGSTDTKSTARSNESAFTTPEKQISTNNKTLEKQGSLFDLFFSVLLLFGPYSRDFSQQTNSIHPPALGARAKANLFPAASTMETADGPTTSPNSDSPIIVPPPKKSRLSRKRSRKPAQGVAVTLLSQKSDKLLDSVFLQWRLHHKKLTSLPAKQLIDVFRKEALRFQKYSPRRCRKLAAQIQNAFELIIADAVEIATLKSIDNPGTLRDSWVEEIFDAIKEIQRKLDSASTFGKKSVVGEFLGSIPSPSPPPIPRRHPPGEVRVANRRAKKNVSFEDSSSSDDKLDGEYSVSSSDDDDTPAPKKSKPSKSRPPLALDDAAVEHTKALRSAKSMREWKTKTINWIADNFGNGSPHIKQIVAGRFRNLDWSRKQLSRAAERIIALYDKVALRESLGDQVSRDNKKAMLASESSALADIRISLHVIRLGAEGARRYHQKVEDEKSRLDFELVSGTSRSFKIFSKELASSQKAKAASAVRRRFSSSRSSRTPRPRSSRGRRERGPRNSNRRKRPTPRYRGRSRDCSFGKDKRDSSPHPSDRSKTKSGNKRSV